MDRTIFHIDMNGCYAGIECHCDPAIRDKPVAVGGSAEERHGIILAKNEIAKKYGIKTGETLWQARQKCPGLIIVPPHFERYVRFSRMAREIYGDYTDRVEPFGLDECWADVTGNISLTGSGETMANEIRERVKRELGITVSIGVSYNKIFAKLGSDYKKPDAVTVFTKDNFREKIWPLPAGNMIYVGRATERKLFSRGIYTIGDIAATDPALLQSWFGKCGLVLSCFANGEDVSPVSAAGDETVIKSIGNSTTTPRDMTCDEDAGIVYWMLCESVAERMRESGFLCRTVQISLRDSGLFSFERQVRLRSPTSLASEIHAAAMTLLRENYDWHRPLRSIGVRAAELLPAGEPVQMSIFEDEGKRARREALEKTVFDLRRRFGQNALARAVTMSDPTLGRLGAGEDRFVYPGEGQSGLRSCGS